MRRTAECGASQAGIARGIVGHPENLARPMATAAPQRGCKRSLLGCFFQLLVVGGNVLVWSEVIPQGRYADELKPHVARLWIPWLIYIALLFVATIATLLGTVLLKRTVLLLVRISRDLALTSALNTK